MVGRVYNLVFGYVVCCVQFFFEQMIVFVRSWRDDFYYDVWCVFDVLVWIKEVYFFLIKEDKVGLWCIVFGEEDGDGCCENCFQVIFRNMVYYFVKQFRLGVLMLARRCLILIEVVFYKFVNMVIFFWEIYFCESSNINILGINFYNNWYSGLCNIKYKFYFKIFNCWYFC